MVLATAIRRLMATACAAALLNAAALGGTGKAPLLAMA
jgi:hypothetical protein